MLPGETVNGDPGVTSYTSLLSQEKDEEENGCVFALSLPCSARYAGPGPASGKV